MEMKKWKTQLLAAALPLLLCLGLCGCGGAADDTLTLETAAGSVTGTYSGARTEGAPSGEGVFTAAAGWTYSGGFADGTFAAGSAEGMPAVVSAGGSSFAGSYTGAVSALLPDGEGVLTGADGASFSGTFAQGAAADGTAENMPCVAVINGEKLTGAYSGPVAGGLPEGTGTFAVSGNGRSLTYEGGWTAGAPAGAGKLTDDGFTVYTAGETDRGSFEGDTADGVPDGSGSFAARNSEDVDYRYDGDWRGGVWEGSGELIYDSELYYQRRGTFTGGAFTPDTAELLAAYGSVEPKFTLTDKQLAYIAQYPELCDATRDIPDYRSSDYRFLYDLALTFEAYQKEPEKYPESWMMFYNYTILRLWEDDSLGENYKVTRILATNTVYEKAIECYLFGTSATLSKLTYLTLYGIPLGMSSYTSSDGEAVPAIVVLVGSLGGY